MLGKSEKQVSISTIIGSKSELEGDFSVKGAARIDGKINGNVTVTDALIVGTTGNINGNVTAKAVVIGGEIIGNVDASDKAELTATARVLGDITTAMIVIDEHAVFQGRCDMNQTVPDKKAKNRMVKASRAGKKSAKAAIEEALKEVKEEAARDLVINESAPAASTATQTKDSIDSLVEL